MPSSFVPGLSTLPIDIRDLRAGYGKGEILSGIDLSVEPHGRIVLLGPNGAGKTTLLRCLLGLLKPSTGSVRLWGTDPSDPKTRRDLLRRVGASLESPVLPSRVFALEWMEHHAALAGLTSPREAARGVLRAWDLPEGIFADKLSLGQRQRLLVARSLLHRPELLLLDEPAAHLDPTAREEFWSYLESWRVATGATLLVSSHQLEEVSERGGEWVVLGGGKLLHRGPAETFTEDFPSSRLLRLAKPTDPEHLRRILSPLGCALDGVEAAPFLEYRLRPAGGSRSLPTILHALVEAGIDVEGLGEDALSLREAYRACLGEVRPLESPHPVPVDSSPPVPTSPLSDILASATLHNRGLRRELRLLLPFAILLLLLCAGVRFAFPEGAPLSAVSAILAMAALLPCGLAAGLAADLVAGERERKSLETQLSLPTPYRRILAGDVLSILIPGQILSAIAVFATSLALLRTGNACPGSTTLAIVLAFAPAALGLSTAIGLLFSLRSTSARSASQFSTLSTLPLLALSQALPQLVAGPVLPWLEGAGVMAVLASLLGWKISRSLSPESLLR